MGRDAVPACACRRRPATTRLVRYAAAREYEDGNLAEAKRLYEKPLRRHDTASRLRLGSSQSVRNGSRRP